MNKQFMIPTTKVIQRDSTCWAHSYEEILSLYKLSLSSTNPSFRALYHQLIEPQILNLLSFLNENDIQAQAEFDDLNDILNQIKSAEIDKERNNWENGNKARTKGEFTHFIRRIESIKESIKEIGTRQNFEAQKCGFEELWAKKPSLRKAIELRDCIKSLDSDFSHDDLQKLENEIQTCEVWSQKVEDYLGNYEKFLIDDEATIEAGQIKEILKRINLLKEDKNKLVLKEEESENKLYIFDWNFQAKLFLSSGDKGSPPRSDVKYWKDLLNRAKEGECREILESTRYQEVCEEIEKYERLIGQVKDIQDQEKLLLKLENHHKKISLKNRESIEEIRRELTECKVLTSKEDTYLKEISKQADRIMKDYIKMKNSPGFIPVKEFQLIVKQLQKLPIEVPKEIEEQIAKEERITELLQQATAKPSFEFAKRIHHEYERCYLEIPEAQRICREYNKITEIQDLLEHRKSRSYGEIRELENQIDNSSLDLGSELAQRLKVRIWLAQVDLLKTFKEKRRVPEELVPYEKISQYHTQGQRLLAKIHDHDQQMLLAWKSSSEFLQELTDNLALFESLEDPREEKFPFSYFIDIKEKIAELKVAAARKKILEQFNHSLLQKRPEPYPLEETAATSQQIESGGGTPVGDFPISLKRVKLEDGNSEYELIGDSRRILRALEEEEEVSIEARGEAKEKMLKLVENLKGKNLINPREVVEELENKIAIECYWRRKYNEKVEAICVLLEKLQVLRFLRKKLLKQKLEYREIEECLERNLNTLDNEAYEEFKKQSQTEIQPKLEQFIPPQFEPVRLIEEIDDENSKDVTERAVQEIMNSQNYELFTKEEHVPFKDFESYSIDSLAEIPEFNLTDHLDPPQLTDYFTKSSPNHDIDIYFKHYSKADSGFPSSQIIDLEDEESEEYQQGSFGNFFLELRIDHNIERNQQKLEINNKEQQEVQEEKEEEKKKDILDVKRPEEREKRQERDPKDREMQKERRSKRLENKDQQ